MQYPSGNRYRAWTRNNGGMYDARVLCYLPDGQIREKTSKRFTTNKVALSWIDIVISETEQEYAPNTVSEWVEVDGL